jgi:hypothetical protein
MIEPEMTGFALDDALERYHQIVICRHGLVVEPPHWVGFEDME